MSDTYHSGASGPAGATYTVTAMFDSRDDAEDAVSSLIEAGFGQDDVRLLPGAERDVDRDPEVRRSQGSEDPGFWASLRGLFLPEDDSYVYAEGLRRGGYLVSVRTNSANHDRAVDILDDEGTIDLDERAQAWRTEGWTGYKGTGGGQTGAISGAAGTGRVRVYESKVETPASEGKLSGTGATGRDTDRRSR